MSAEALLFAWDWLDNEPTYALSGSVEQYAICW